MERKRNGLAVIVLLAIVAIVCGYRSVSGFS